MSILREQMTRDLDLRGFSPKTKDSYLRQIKSYSCHFMKSPEQLGDIEIKEYLHYLIIGKKLSQSAVSTAYSALKFFYETTLKRDWVSFKIPTTKKQKKLPVVLSREEVKRIFDVTRNIKHRTILMTIYAAGLRVSEAANLKLVDIDSKRMQIKVEQGKGKKDRYTLLSKSNLEILRIYWNAERPKHWLFSGVINESPISERTIQKVFEKAVKRAGIKKKVSVHTLRHSFATHLLESGTDIYHIQQLLGHASVKTTSVYIHVSQHDSLKITSPLDSILGGRNE